MRTEIGQRASRPTRILAAVHSAIEMNSPMPPMPYAESDAAAAMLRDVRPFADATLDALQNGIPSANMFLKGGEVDRMIRLMSSIFTDLWHDWLQERVEAVGLFFP